MKWFASRVSFTYCLPRRTVYAEGVDQQTYVPTNLDHSNAVQTVPAGLCSAEFRPNLRIIKGYVDSMNSSYQSSPCNPFEMKSVQAVIKLFFSYFQALPTDQEPRSFTFFHHITDPFFNLPGNGSRAQYQSVRSIQGTEPEKDRNGQ